MKTEELKTKIEDCLPIENYGVCFIDCDAAGVDKAVNKLLLLFLSEIEAAERRRTEEVFNIMRDAHQTMEASGKSDAKFLEGHGFAVLSIREMMLEQSSKFLKNPEQ